MDRKETNTWIDGREQPLRSAEEAEGFFGTGEAGNLDESPVNTNIKLLYQEGAAIASLPNACTKENAQSAERLWSVVNRMVSQMYIPILRMLIKAILEKD